MLGSRAISESFAAIVAVDRRTIHHRCHTADLGGGVSFDMETVASGCERTLDVVKSRGKDDASIPGIRHGPRGKYERRLSHLDIELLRSCGTHVSSARVAGVKGKPILSCQVKSHAWFIFPGECTVLRPPQPSRFRERKQRRNGQNQEDHRGRKDCAPPPTSRYDVRPVHIEFLIATRSR